MTASNPIVFGPNRDGWHLTIEWVTDSPKGYDYLVSLQGPKFSFVAGTMDDPRDFPRFISDLREVTCTLSGCAYLRTDYFELKVTTETRGHLIFEGELTCYQFEQYPLGSVSVSFVQVFDPITVEQALASA